MRRVVSRRRSTLLSAGRPGPAALGDGVVTLRLPETADVARLAVYGRDERLLDGRWVGRPAPGEDVRVWAGRCVDEWRAGWTESGSDRGPALVVDEAAPFVGIVHVVPRAADTLELLYGVLPTVRNRGVATRAARLAAEWALGAGACRRVTLQIDESNPASRRVAEKAGFGLVERVETFVAGTGKIYIDLLYELTAP